MYNPAMGVWTIRDPAQEGLNLYENVKSNPANLTDPMGLESFPARVPATLGPSLPKGFGDSVTPCVSQTAQSLVSTGAQFWALAPQNEYGTIHFVSFLTQQTMGYGAGMQMDFVPSETTQKCCKEINIIQSIRMVVGGNPATADWHSGSSGNRSETGRATQWSNNGRYIERSHMINTPFMAGSPNMPEDGGGPMGQVGGGGNPLLWGDYPAGTADPFGTKPSGQEFETCIICNDGAYKGRVLGCISHWGWRFTPAKALGSGARQGMAEALKPAYNRSPTWGMYQTIRSWNKYAETQQWPPIQVDWDQWNGR